MCTHPEKVTDLLQDGQPNIQGNNKCVLEVQTQSMFSFMVI